MGLRPYTPRAHKSLCTSVGPRCPAPSRGTHRVWRPTEFSAWTGDRRLTGRKALIHTQTKAEQSSKLLEIQATSQALPSGISLRSCRPFYSNHSNLTHNALFLEPPHIFPWMLNTGPSVSFKILQSLSPASHSSIWVVGAGSDGGGGAGIVVMPHQP